MATNPMKIGNYILMETLGVGSFGKVKLAVHSTTGHRVAMKIINRRRIATMNMVERIKREIQYLKLLRHPHIIKLYEVITTPTDIIMVMEYAPFELFNFIVEKGKVTEDETRRFFQQIISAVDYCHRHKIVHRDLKPENVLLDENYNVKIADFGLSNIMTDGDFLKTSCGSPNYAAPEVINGKLYAGPEVDVWSCGVMLYVMLCGRLPFDDEYIPLLFKKISGGIFSLPSYLSPEAKQLLSSMLVVDPLKRITIENIRKNKWFNTNLPDYLQPFISTPEDYTNGMDESIIKELKNKLGYSREQIIRSLKAEGENQIKVACALLIDHKRMITDAKSKATNSKNIESFLAQSPPAWDAVAIPHNSLNSNDGLGSISPSIQILSSSLPRKPYYNNEPASINYYNNSLPPIHPASPGQMINPLNNTMMNVDNHQMNTQKNMVGLGVNTIGNGIGADGNIGGSSVINSQFKNESQYTPNTNSLYRSMATSSTTTNNVNGSLMTSPMTTDLKNNINVFNPEHITTTSTTTSVMGSSAATTVLSSTTPPTGIMSIPTHSSPLSSNKAININTQSFGPLVKEKAMHSPTMAGAGRNPIATPIRKHKTRSKWHFGIRSKSLPLDIMLEIYKALKKIGMKWKSIDQYHIRVLYESKCNKKIKFDIQLYQIENNSYLVDFKDAMPPTRTSAQNPIKDNSTSTFESSSVSSLSNIKSQPMDIKNNNSNLTKQIKNNGKTPMFMANQEVNDINMKMNFNDTNNNNNNNDDLYESLIASNFDKMNLMFVPEEEEVNLRAFIFFDACAKLITELALSS